MATTWKGNSKKRRRPGKTSAPHAVKDAAGRVHLVLHGEGAGRSVTGLSAGLFSEPWQDTVTLTAANAVLRHFGTAPDLGSVEGLAKEAMAALSKLAEGLAAQSARAVACSAGCAHCCHQSVGVTGVEALTIVCHVKSTWSPEDLSDLTSRVRATHELTRNMTYKQRHSPALPCVFLRNSGECSIYSVRPLVCRAVNSLNANECRENLHDEAKRAAYLENGLGASALLGPIRASHAMSAGLQMAGADVYGLDMRPLDLVAIVDLLLHAEDAGARWLDGQPVFEDAHGSDATANAELRKLAGLKPNKA